MCRPTSLVDRGLTGEQNGRLRNESDSKEHSRHKELNTRCGVGLINIKKRMGPNTVP